MAFEIVETDGGTFESAKVPARGHRGGELILVFEKSEGGRHMSPALGATVNGVQVVELVNEMPTWVDGWEEATDIPAPKPKKKRAAKKAAAKADPAPKLLEDEGDSDGDA